MNIFKKNTQFLIKKILSFFIITGIITGCSTSAPKHKAKTSAEIYIKNEDYTTDGDFFDENNFQVFGYGTWPEDYINKRVYDKSKIAKENASLDAQNKTIEIFKKYALKAKGNIESEIELSDETLKRIEDYGRNGTIIKTTFDEEYNHTVVYRVYVKGLKKMVESGFKDITP